MCVEMRSAWAGCIRGSTILVFSFSGDAACLGWMHTGEYHLSVFVFVCHFRLFVDVATQTSRIGLLFDVGETQVTSPPSASSLNEMKM